MNIDNLSIKSHHYHNSFIHSLSNHSLNSVYTLPSRAGTGCWNPIISNSDIAFASCEFMVYNGEGH